VTSERRRGGIQTLPGLGHGGLTGDEAEGIWARLREQDARIAALEAKTPSTPPGSIELAGRGVRVRGSWVGVVLVVALLVVGVAAWRWAPTSSSQPPQQTHGGR
jgi:hypothetical protein